jgi:hypothetical protein
VRPHTINLPSATGQVTTLAGCIGYFTFRNTSASNPATLQLWDGTTNAGYLILDISLAANESTSDRIGWHYQRFETGLYYELVTGAVEGSVSVLFEHRCEDMMRPQVVVNIPIDELAAYAATLQQA